MLAIQAALCLLTGSREMLVFHTLLAGNSWHFGAPGTDVPGTDVPGTGVAVCMALSVSARPDTAPGRAAAVSDAAQVTAAAASARLRGSLLAQKCPVSVFTLASWHGLWPGTGQPANPAPFPAGEGGQKRGARLSESSTVRTMAARPLRDLVAPDWAK